MGASEEQLQAWMIQGLGGDAAAHRALLRALLPMLRRYYRRRMPGQDDAIEDLVQETLIAVHTRRATYDPDRPFTAWLHAIARYKMIDAFRRGGRTVSIDGLEELAAEDNAHDASDASADLDKLLAGLSPKQEAAIRATRIEGLSTAEAARRQSIGESDVKISVHRGLKRLAALVRGEQP